MPEEESKKRRKGRGDPGVVGGYKGSWGRPEEGGRIKNGIPEEKGRKDYLTKVVNIHCVKEGKERCVTKNALVVTPPPPVQQASQQASHVITSSFKEHRDSIKDCLIFSKYDMFMSSSLDGKFIIYNPNNVMKIFSGHSKGLSGLLLSEDEKMVYSSSYDSYIKKWDLERGWCTERMKADSAILALSNVVEESLIFSDNTNQINQVDLRTRIIQRKFNMEDEITSIRFVDDRSFLCCGRKLYYMDMRSSKSLEACEGGYSDVEVFDLEGKKYCVVSNKKEEKAKIIEIRQGMGLEVRLENIMTPNMSTSVKVGLKGDSSRILYYGDRLGCINMANYSMKDGSIEEVEFSRIKRHTEEIKSVEYYKGRIVSGDKYGGVKYTN